MLTLPTPEPVHPTQPKIDLRLIAAIPLLAVAAAFTWLTIDGLTSRYQLRVQLAEISHARYGLLNPNVWVERLVPILESKIDRLDFQSADVASLRPTVRNALNNLLASVKEKMSGGKSQGAGGLMGQGNALIANMVVAALQPRVPEFTEVVLAELSKPESREAFRNAFRTYIRSALAEGAKSTFGNVDMRWHSYILQQHGCADAAACKVELTRRIDEADTRIRYYHLTVLASSALAFLLSMAGRPVLRRAVFVVLLLFCAVLLAGGVLTPMIEVEARISQMNITFLGVPVVFSDQVLYFQSKSVLQVFRALIATGRTEMWVVGVLVLMFSVVFPIMKLLTSSLCLYQPDLLRRSRVAKFFALESSKWSMAHVMALAIFMAFVAFNGLIANTMGGLKETGAQLTIPTDSSTMLPGCYLFVGFCVASLFVSRKLEQALRAKVGQAVPPAVPPAQG